jgi:hypothetical protein
MLTVSLAEDDELGYPFWLAKVLRYEKVNVIISFYP